MQREDCLAYVKALNTLQPHLPPLLFDPLVNGPVARTIIAVANGQAVVAVMSAPMPQPAATQQATSTQE